MNVENKLESYENCLLRIQSYRLLCVRLGKKGDCRGSGGKIFNEEKGHQLDLRGENYFDRRCVNV